MGELARASGVSAATIKHYLREGLLPEPVKTSRNMAYYPAEFVDRIKMIKQLQEERYMPLRVIKDLLEEDPDRARALIELGDKLLEHALAGESERVSAAEVRDRYDVPEDVLDRLAELEVLTPDKQRLLAERRPHHRGDQPLPRRRLRGADRLHRLRHAALQGRDGRPGQAGGRRADGASRRRDGSRRGDGADRGRQPAAQRPARRDAHQGAGRRAGAPARPEPDSNGNDGE